MKLRPVEADLFHADGQTDMTKLIVALRNFANVPIIYPNSLLFFTLISVYSRFSGSTIFAHNLSELIRLLDALVVCSVLVPRRNM